MRIPKSLSYSSMCLFYKDRDEFYLRYLAEHAPPRLPQERPMAAGAGFDARIKSSISDYLNAGDGPDPQFEFQTIFESQVEPHNRDFALEASKYIFEAYKATGSYTDLLALLNDSVEKPRMEFTVENILNGVPFLGKPDLRFILKYEDYIDCIWDFKVKGYCSKYGASPSKGYMCCRNTNGEYAGGRSHEKEHKNYLAYSHHGLIINSGYMEFCNDEYADQLTLYGWLLGEKIGDENVVLGIEEIVCAYKEGQPPAIRVANHRGRVKADYQLKLIERLTACWTAITTGHVFTDLSRQENDEHCAQLEQVAIGLMSDGSALDKFYNECTRPQFMR